MAMGGYKIGDVKQGFAREPTYITLEVPLSMRSQFSRVGTLPVMTDKGTTVPLSELGRFVSESEQDIIYHKDLRPVEYVTGNGIGRLGAPIYGMLEVQDILDSNDTLKGLQGNFVTRPDGVNEPGFMWAGEWTVTYQTFRDMGLAFGIALLIIYMLVVWEFKNFVIPLIVMAPIPLTLIGIIPGHWIMGAEFTATSMIGFIALAGIIVRNSILLVDFARQEVRAGESIIDAVIYSCKARTRPIMITAAALVLGSSVILFDPIFQGMAVSLMFGVVVATVLTLVVIPLGCVSAESAFIAMNAEQDAPVNTTLTSKNIHHDEVIEQVSKTPITAIIDPFFATSSVVTYQSEISQHLFKKSVEAARSLNTESQENVSKTVITEVIDPFFARSSVINYQKEAAQTRFKKRLANALSKTEEKAIHDIIDPFFAMAKNIEMPEMTSAQKQPVSHINKAVSAQTEMPTTNAADSKKAAKKTKAKKKGSPKPKKVKSSDTPKSKITPVRRKRGIKLKDDHDA